MLSRERLSVILSKNQRKRCVWKGLGKACHNGIPGNFFGKEHETKGSFRKVNKKTSKKKRKKG